MTSLSSNTHLISTINNELSLAYQDEEEFWKQRSHQIWLVLGDKNTWYYFQHFLPQRMERDLTQ